MFKKILSSTLVIGMVLGVLLWGGFNWSLELTNTEQFCISCHEMEANVYQELQQTVHWSNRTGVRATCPDCHVPKEWTHKVVRKIKASKELYHWMLGTIDTPQKFDDYRLTMAMSEWKRMKQSDSRECRNCHDFASMDLAKQEERSAERHEPHFWEVHDGKDPSQTCIDCHKGIAHKLPVGWEAAVKADPLLRPAATSVAN
ncbi:MAG: NapC/NirT family cytochrome c [Gammaproteobacteria bacterium SHHR-1]|uniref:NapC/NirT family cytochrome c n=1 Tax=Magnetovirga frankeli TaxID=947516 RepID=UPI0012934713|nr:NapC/NirT family cytochrome c [gamma proteobacterium SS-5]